MVALKTIYHTANLMVMVKDIQHAIKEVRDCIESYDIPSSEWTGGQVFDNDNKYLGKITYNGKWIPLPTFN
jgi:hypothetical protein